MNRDIIDINDFTILIEESRSIEQTVDTCTFDEPVVAIAFYGSGNVDMSVRYGEKLKSFNHTKAMALSFYADEEVAFEHVVSAGNPLECIVVATAIGNLEKLPNEEGELFDQLLNQLVNPSDHYVEGPRFYMTPEMNAIISKVFNNQYEGKTKMMFFRSQMTALLAHFFGEIANLKNDHINENERDKLFKAREILSSNMDSPPSLSELSKQIGLNSFKLKKNFKELFGVPVFKYLQNERLTKAHDLLRTEPLSIQEIAWHVGYDSLSSFSNAFVKKFGIRPSEIKR